MNANTQIFKEQRARQSQAGCDCEIAVIDRNYSVFLIGVKARDGRNGDQIQNAEGVLPKGNAIRARLREPGTSS